MAVHDYQAAPAYLRATPAQARCDAIQAQFRAEQAAPEQPARRSIRRDAPTRPPAPGPTEDQLRTRLAEELDYARRLLDGMGDTLANDPIVVTRHVATLQAVDIVGQLLGHIAAVVRASDPAAAVEAIGMSDLKARLTRKTLF